VNQRLGKLVSPNGCDGHQAPKNKKWFKAISLSLCIPLHKVLNVWCLTPTGERDSCEIGESYEQDQYLISLGVELDWVQLQICHGIEMSCNSNSIVWMLLNWSLELCGPIPLSTEEQCSVLGAGVSNYSPIPGN
jgi:hypothetical protein